MAAIQDLVLTFCPTMPCVTQRKLKLLMPVLRDLIRSTPEKREWNNLGQGLQLLIWTPFFNGWLYKIIPFCSNWQIF